MSSNKFSHTLSSRVKELEKAEHHLLDFLDNNRLDSTLKHGVLLVAHEYILNLIEHGFEYNEYGVIELDCVVGGEDSKINIEVTVKDNGPVPEHQLKDDISKEGAGFGLVLINSIASKIESQKNGSFNITTFCF